jgi:hypothetical protein
MAKIARVEALSASTRQSPVVNKSCQTGKKSTFAELGPRYRRCISA